MNRLVPFAVLTAVVVVASLAFAGTGSGAAARAKECPKDPLRLGPAAPSAATVAALAEAPDLYGPKHERVRVDGAMRAPSAGDRGVQVRRMCGKEAFRRTVVVWLTFPELRPSASLSQGIVFVSRASDGYHVWFVAH